MRKMGKGKAMSVDGVSDSIFRRETWNKIFREDCLRMSKQLLKKEMQVKRNGHYT